ncbi:cutinase-2 [Stachybotrys elegans]|uniref:Cutinase n=1 Tax=Stachybotrys elegans TaxID=80388 RepID=A0A8K0T5P6_9HYPO|nr:cutinase-2 [Stachybotrys elegans]
MKTFFALALAAAAAANPIGVRQLGNRVGISSNEFTEGGCKPIIMLFARGSTEVGNMGTVCGPPTGEGLKRNFGADNVAVEGIEYAAAVSTNLLPGGADLRGIQAMKDLIAQANTECPDSMLVVGGYSQGAALTHRAVEDLPQAQKDQIVAAFTFGDTKNQQDNGQIPNFPPEKTNIICNTGDAVCRGLLTILPAHLTYGTRADEQVDFLTEKLVAAGAQRQ